MYGSFFNIPLLSELETALVWHGWINEVSVFGIFSRTNEVGNGRVPPLSFILSTLMLWELIKVKNLKIILYRHKI